MNPLLAMLDFVLQSFFNLAILILMLRLLLDHWHINHNNGFYRFIVGVTQPIIKFGKKCRIKNTVLMLVLTILVFQTLEVFLSDWIVGRSIVLTGAIIVGIGELLSLLVYIYIFSIIIQAILSWVMPNQYHPLNEVLVKVTAPLLNPAKRIIPPIQQVDISPVVVLILLGAAHIFTQWLIWLGDGFGG